MAEQQPSQQQQQQQYRKHRAAHCIRKFIRGLNCFAILSSFLAIAALLVLRHHPTWTGWVLFSLALVTIIAATVGCVSASASAHGRCLSLHFVTVGLSLGGLGVASLALFIRHSLLRKHLKSELSNYHTRIFLHLIKFLFLLMLCIQGIVLLLAFALRQCDYADRYEDLEKRSVGGRKNMARVREESELQVVVQDDGEEVGKEMKQCTHQKQGEAESVN